MNNRRRYQILSEFPLRLIGLISMTLDHIGYFLGTDSQVGYVFRILGRFSFPIFALLLAEGFRYTRSREKYLLRIGVLWAAVTGASAILNYGFRDFVGSMPSNPITDLLVCFLFLYFIEAKTWRKAFAILPLGYLGLSLGLTFYESQVSWSVTIQWFPEFLWAAYSVFGLCLVLGFYYAPKIVEAICKKSCSESGISLESFRETPQYRGLVNTIGATVLFITTLIFWGISYIGRTETAVPNDPYNMAIQSYCILAIIPLMMYNGKRGYDSKPFRWCSYLYFPVHIVLIALVFFLK